MEEVAITDMVANVTGRVNNLLLANVSSAEQPLDYAVDVPKRPPSKRVITAYLQHKLQEERRSGKVPYREMKRWYGMSHVALANLLNHGRGVGQKMVTAYAARHFANSLDEFYADVEAFREARGMSDDASGAPSDEPSWRSRTLRYPRLVWALEMGLDGGLDRDFLETFASEAEDLRGEDETDAGTWWMQIQSAYVRRRNRAAAEKPQDAVRAAKELPQVGSSKGSKPRRPRRS